jgi:hypothetical protein
VTKAALISSVSPVTGSIARLVERKGRTGKFDRVGYQREYMRKRRAREKMEREGGK